MTTAVPSLIFGPNGIVAPQEPDILAGFQTDIDAAFGGGVNPGLTTAQGQIAVTLTAVEGDNNDQLLAIFNNFDPLYAQGRAQDALGRAYSLTRIAGAPTSVVGLCTGATGALIPAGTLARAGTQTFISIEDGTIGVGGTVSIQFSATALGPIACPAGTLGLYQSVPGLDTISNPADGVLGRDVETRAEFETRRQDTIQANSVGSIGAIIGQVAQAAGVIDYCGFDNSSSSAVTIFGVTVAANSIYIGVAGGAAADIGAAILRKKAPGAAYTGGTTVTVDDANPLYSTPVPYSVKFQMLASTAVFIAVSIPNTTAVPSNALALLQAAVISAFTGADGGPRARTAMTIYASRYYAAIASLGAWAQIISVFIGEAASPTGNSITLTAAQVPTIVPANITLTLV